jgi:hypothetical protein
MILVRNTILFFLAFVSAVSVSQVSASYTYTPAATIAMTGSNSEVFFDIEDDIINAGTLE